MLESTCSSWFGVALQGDQCNLHLCWRIFFVVLMLASFFITLEMHHVICSSLLAFAFIARKMPELIYSRNKGWGGKGARGIRGGNRGPRDWWVRPSSESPMYVYSLFPPFLPLPECSQMSSRCSSELRCDTSYFSKKLLRSMHIHTHVPLLVCCNASASWVVVKTQLSSGRHSTQSRIAELSCC